jgi:hypothetical protein
MHYRELKRDAGYIATVFPSLGESGLCSGVHRLNFTSIATHTHTQLHSRPNILHQHRNTVDYGYKPPVNLSRLYLPSPPPPPSTSLKFRKWNPMRNKSLCHPASMNIHCLSNTADKLTTRHWRLARSFLSAISRTTCQRSKAMLSGYLSYNMLVGQGHFNRLSLVQHVSGARSFAPAISCTTC